jgi:alcohol dehydrogenase
MNELFEKSIKMLSEWKGDSYIFGRSVIDRLGSLASVFGKNALVICNTANLKNTADAIIDALKGVGISLVSGAIVPGAGLNTPRVDVYRIETYILHHKPDMIVAAGGGSTIDACKAANFLAALGAEVTPEIDHWLGMGLVSEALKKSGKKLTPLIAVQTAASSGAHLTKYANITDPSAGQKKLVVD